MAVDSADKRLSAAAAGIPTLPPWAPAPDGGLDSGGDRLQVAGFYRGIAASVLGIPVSVVLAACRWTVSVAASLWTVEVD